jgi:hypothetical protein
MSIKIWQAYKVPVSKLNEALVYLAEVMIKERIYSSYKIIVEAFIKRENLEVYNALLKAENATKEASLSHLNGFCNLDCSIGIYIYKSYAYLIPYGYYFKKVPEYLVDFHYQNQVDNELTIKEQTKRKKIWEILFTLPEMSYIVYEGTGLGRYNLSRMYMEENKNE